MIRQTRAVVVNPCFLPYHAPAMPRSLQLKPQAYQQPTLASAPARREPSSQLRHSDRWTSNGMAFASAMSTSSIVCPRRPASMLYCLPSFQLHLKSLTAIHSSPNHEVAVLRLADVLDRPIKIRNPPILLYRDTVTSWRVQRAWYVAYKAEKTKSYLIVCQ
jgi:hypothetical protein